MIYGVVSLDCSFKIYDSRFVVLKIVGLRKDYFIIGKIGYIWSGGVANIYRLFELFRNFILGLSLFGGDLIFIVCREEGVYNAFLILHASSIVEKKLKNWIREALAYINSFSNLANLKWQYVDYKRARDIVSFLLRRFVGLVAIREFEIRNYRYQIAERAGRSWEFDSILGGAISTGGDVCGIYLPAFKDGTFLIVGANLDSIKLSIKRRDEAFFKIDSQREGNINRKVELERHKFKVMIVTGMMVARTPNKTYSLTLNIRNIYQNALQLPKLILSKSLIERKPKERTIKNTILGLLMNMPYGITIDSKLNSFLCFLLPIMVSILFVRKRSFFDPHLDIYEHATKGEIQIGWQLYSGERLAPFHIGIKDLRRHVLILGKTGTGKSRLARIIAEEIVRKKISKIWIFDFHKEYLDLTRKYDFEVYEPGTTRRALQVNIFDSQYEEKESYASFLTAILLETIKMRGEEATAQMERAISYATWATVHSHNPSPTTFLSKLYEWCKEAEETLPSALYTFHAVANRLKPLFSGVSKYIFWVRRSNIDISDLVNRNVIFDLSYLFKRNLKNEIFLLVNILLRYTVMALFKWEYLLPENKPPRLVLLVEEGRYLVPWRKISSSIDTTAVEDFATLARKYGLGLIIIAQSPHLISQDIISNSGTLFLMNTDIPEREYPILENEELRKYIQMMPPRHAIVKLSSASSLIHIEVKQHHIEPYVPPAPTPEQEYLLQTQIIPLDFEDWIREIISLGSK